MKQNKNNLFGKILNLFRRKKSIEEIAEIELKKINSKFYISRTGVEMLDENHLRELPPIFNEVYGKYRKTPEEFDALDKKSIELRNISNSLRDYRKKAKKIHYANCTMLAGFMCDVLTTNRFNAKIFGIGAEHHFVIAKTETPYELLIVDPWAGKQFKVTLKENVSDLEILSVDSRLAICKAHFQETNLYPESDYIKILEEINAYDVKSATKDTLLKQAYSISPVERFFEFENKNANKPSF